jgi:hypothetical protein
MEIRLVDHWVVEQILQRVAEFVCRPVNPHTPDTIEALRLQRFQFILGTTDSLK